MLTIRDQNHLETFKLHNAAGTRILLLPNGAIGSIFHQQIMINQVLGSPLEGGLQNLYLRVRTGRRMTVQPLIGPGADSEFTFTPGRSAAWQGRVKQLEYVCTLRLDLERSIWFWAVQVANRGLSPVVWDVLFSQDLGLAGEFAVRTSEAYTSQYLDHTILRHDQLGFIIGTRQNQPQAGRFPWILHGNLQRSVGFLTDGFQFFGRSCKATGRPEMASRARLPNRNLQYEFAFPTLQTAPLRIGAGQKKETVFFACYLDSHPQATDRRDLRMLKDVRQAWKRLSAQSAPTAAAARQPKLSSLFNRAPLLAGRELKPQERKQYFGGKIRQVEKRNGKLLSFFYGENRYVALAAKELLTDRPHGHILRSGRSLLPSDELLSSTAYMFGVFHSQVTVGNTNLHKLLSVMRNPLNLLRSSGLRIFLRDSGSTKLLGLPSAFEMGPQHARWIYRLADGVLLITAWASLEGPMCFLQIESPERERELLLSHNVVLGNFEYESAGQAEFEPERGRVFFKFAPESAMAKKYPGAGFFLAASDPAQVAELAGDGPLFSDGQERSQPFITLRTKPVKKFGLVLGGHLDNKIQDLADRYAQNPTAWEQAEQAAEEHWRSFTRNGKLRPARTKTGAEKLGEILPWYAHNAMVHFTVPHGLEQNSGAAWGLRDVCQGPMEFLLATRQFAAMREVLRIVFSHQYRGTGDWPQWFMFDRYREIQSPESHADIIIWPLKAVCDYLEATGDSGILSREIPYTDDKTFQITPETATLWAHLERLMAKIERDCIPGTALAKYGHGDWEDTLQPANPALRARLVSAWTVELIFQTCARFAVCCGRFGQPAWQARLQGWCERIRRDFNRYLVRDGVVAGLAYFASARKVSYLLHPRDRKTQVRYRLLPMTRGIISGLFTPQQARTHLRLIERYLMFPDGVRLMDRPLRYYGGIEKTFRRAESAANFGREIGLQYVHAHIRYLEAMAKLGLADQLFHGLLAVNPIDLQRVVPTAEPRQSNAYFSSSDAAFPDRYTARAQFAKIKNLKVPLKGGWRIYSSGPGIYLNQLITNFLGLKEWYDHVLLDPVVPKKLNGLAFDYEYEGKRVTYRYHVGAKTYSPERVTVNGRAMKLDGYADNPYRRGGALIPHQAFLQALDRESNTVDIYL